MGISVCWDNFFSISSVQPPPEELEFDELELLLLELDELDELEELNELELEDELLLDELLEEEALSTQRQLFASKVGP